MQTEIEAAREAIQALNFGPYNEQIAEYRAEIDRVNAAIAAGEARCSEISRTLIEARGPDAKAVADALLDSGDAMVAARSGPTDAELMQERASLRAGLTELRDRLRDLHEAIEQTRREVSSALQAATTPVADAIMADMRRAALQLLDGYAAIAALGAGIRGHHGSREMAEAALEGLLTKGGPERLLNWRSTHPVAPELVDLLASVTGKGDAVRAAALSEVPLR